MAARFLRAALHVRYKNQAYSEYKHSLTFRARRYVVTSTNPVHRLQIRPIVHNYRAPPTTPPSYIQVRAVVWECGEGQTHRHTDRRDQYAISPRLSLARNVTSEVVACVVEDATDSVGRR